MTEVKHIFDLETANATDRFLAKNLRKPSEKRSMLELLFQYTSVGRHVLCIINEIYTAFNIQLRRQIPKCIEMLFPRTSECKHTF